MSRCGSWAQTAIVGTLICVVCSIPSCFLAPLNTIVKYLACVVIYPRVRLTWSGLALCVPDLRLLLQTRVYVSLLVMYFILWLLWPGRDRVYMVLKPPVWTVKKSYHGWVSLMEHTRACLSWVIYQQGWLSWSDTQWLRGATVNRQGIPNIQSLRSRSVWQSGSWREVSNKVYHLHVRAHALIWHVTSYHVCLHVRMWFYVVEWIFRRFISNRVLRRAGPHVDVLHNHKVKFFLGRQLPLRAVSRWWGRVNQIELPLWLRVPVIRLYVRVFGVNIAEALVTDLTRYRNISEFFRRSLKPHLRPVDKAHCLTSPADGRVLHIGTVDGGCLEQIKGVTYSLREFMGRDHKFMEAFRSRRTLFAADPDDLDRQVEYIENDGSNMGIHTDIHIGPADQHGRQCDTDTSSLCDTDQYCNTHSSAYVDKDMGDFPADFSNHKSWTSECKYTSNLFHNLEDSTHLIDLRNNENSENFTESEHSNKHFGISDTSFDYNNFPLEAVQVQSSYTKMPIRLCDSSKSLSDNYQVEEHIIEQVFSIKEEDLLSHQASCGKNANYFLPPSVQVMPTVTPSSEKHMILEQEATFARNLLINPDNVLHQCIVYLAPGDYHRFHSPVDWTVYSRRHFTGNLFSVNPKLAGWLQGLFSMNERVMYTGRWQHGLFSMTAVGATNVGSINVFFDKTLRTNSSKADLDQYSYNETNFRSRDRTGVRLSRGQLMGDFNLGSTIVLLFEAPPSFKLRYQPGDRVKYGQGMVELNRQMRLKSKQRKRRPARNK